MLRPGLSARVSTHDQQTLAMQNHAMRTPKRAVALLNGPEPYEHEIVRVTGLIVEHYALSRI
jgi:hypothetical protein